MDNGELISFLRDENLRFIALKMPTLKSTLRNIRFASDFDVYNALCENLYLIAGHPIRIRLLSLLAKCSKSEISVPLLYDSEYRKKLWQRIFFDEKVDLPTAFNGSFDDKKTTSYVEANGFCINSVIDYSFENIRQLLDDIIVKIEKSNANEIIFDARKIIFSRPDDFHSQEAYKSCKNQDGDSSLVELWLLCRILMKTELTLNLIIDSAKIAEQILELVFRISSVKKVIISFDISSEIEYADVYNILSKYSQKNISLELIGYKENENDFIKFLSVVPIAFVERINVAHTTVLNNLLEEQEIPLIISYLCRAT